MTELEFKSLAAEGYNRIPLLAEAFADLETPLTLYLKLAQTQNAGKNTFLLEKYVTKTKKISILHDALFMFLSLTTKLRKLIHLFLHWQINVSPIRTRSFQMRDFSVISRSVSKRGR